MTDAQACVYAAMILHDAGVATTGDKIAAVIAAAGIELRPTVPVLFANYLAKKSMKDLIAASGSAAPAAGGSAAAAPAAGNAAPAAAKKEEPKKKEEKKPEPEDDDDLMGGLF